LAVAVVVAVTIAAVPVVLAINRGESEPDGWDSRVTDLVDFVERERGLAFEHAVSIAFLTPDHYADRAGAGVAGLNPEDRARLERRTGFLRAVGLASGDSDLVESTEDMAASGTLAFYDSMGEVVVVRGTEMSVNLRVTLVHELTHVLQDQHFDIDRLYGAGGTGDPSGRPEAIAALVEGDAMRIEHAYIDQLSSGEFEEYASVYDQQRTEAGRDVAEVPAALVASGLAPYALGRPLVELIAVYGGNPAVDATFADPPTTAEHMFDPQTYLDRQEPTSLRAPIVPGQAEEQDSGELGAIDLYMILAKRIDPLVALDATDGWGNGRFVSYERGGRTCVDMTLEGDSDPDDQQLREALRSWVAAAPREAGAWVSASVTDLGGDPGETLVRSCDPGIDVDATNRRVLDVLTIPAYRSLVAVLAADDGATVDDAWAAGDCFIRHLTLDQLMAGDAFSAFSDLPPDLQRAVNDAFETCGL